MNNFFYSPTKKHALICLAIVIGLVFLAFSPVLSAKFLHYNDYTNVVSNEQIRSLSASNIKEIFTSKIGNVYVPLTVSSWAVEYRFFKLNPFVYHLNNLLLHLAVVALIFFLARKIGLSIMASSFAALLFGIHPAHVESVAWVTERRDVLYSFFYVAALLTYMYHCVQFLPGAKRSVQGNRYLILATGLGVLSILAKPMALSLPIVLLLFDWFKWRPFSLRCVLEKLPLMVIMGAITWLSDVPFMWNRWESIKESLLIFPWSVIFYIKQFVLPLVLMPIYRVPQPVDLTNSEYVFSLAVFVVIIVAFVIFRRYKWFVFALLFYLFSIFFLLRVSAESQINLVADRFMYMPSLGICLLLGYVFDRLFNLGRAVSKPIVRYLPMAFLVVLFLLLGVKTYSQARIWHNDETLWEHQLNNNPQEHVALTHLATSLMDQKEYKDAVRRYRYIRSLKISDEDIRELEDLGEVLAKLDYIESLFKRSIKINPRQPEGHYNLAVFYEAVGAVEQALLHYTLAATLNPQFSDLNLRIGMARILLNEQGEAVASFERLLSQQPTASNYVKVLMAYKNALSVHPDSTFYRQALDTTLARYVALMNEGEISAEQYFGLGLVYETLEQFDNALRAYKMALNADARNVDTLYHLGKVSMTLNQPLEALNYLNKALVIDGRQARVLYEKGVLLSQLKRKEEAVQAFEALVKIHPEHVKGLFNLAFLYEQNKNIVKAKETYERVVALDEDNDDAYYNLGNIYATIGNTDAARASYERAVAINPNYGNAWINLTVLAFQEGDVEAAYEYYKQAQLFDYDAPLFMLNVFKERGLI